MPQGRVTGSPGGGLSLRQPGGCFHPFHPGTVQLPQALGPVPGLWCRSQGMRCCGSLMPVLQPSPGAGVYFPPPWPAQSHPKAQADRSGQPSTQQVPSAGHPSSPSGEMLTLLQADAAQHPFWGWMKSHSYCTRWYLQQLELLPCSWLRVSEGRGLKLVMTSQVTMRLPRVTCSAGPGAGTGSVCADWWDLLGSMFAGAGREFCTEHPFRLLY